MEELYLSSEALRSLSQITRYLILKYDKVIKMSDPDVLIDVFKYCKTSKDNKVEKMFVELIDEISKPVDDDATSFIFIADQNVLNTVGASSDNFVTRDRFGNERIKNYR